MPMLGRLLRVTVWGESHGPAVGAVVEGAPPGIPLTREIVEEELARRRPGRRYTTPRREPDRVEILSGVHMGYTTGAPVAMLIWNRDVDSSFYEKVVRHRPRPGHADAAARLNALGFEDYRGGGPFSGRLTAGLVAAGALAKQLLRLHGVEVYAYLRRLAGKECPLEPPRSPAGLEELRRMRDQAPVPCPVPAAAEEMAKALEEAVARGGSAGGIVEAWILSPPPGMGEPLSGRLDAELAHAMLAIPGVKAFELGSGTRLADMTGREAADALHPTPDGGLALEPGHGGGTLGGLALGAAIVARAYVKPTSTIPYPTETIDWRTLGTAETRGAGRHDPAIAVRAVAAVEAAAAIVAADQLLRRLPSRLMHYHWLEKGEAWRRAAEERKKLIHGS